MRDDNTSSLYGLCEAQALRAPDAPAIIGPHKQVLTYAGLEEQIDSTRETLNGSGIGRGDRVGIVLPNGPEMAVAFVSISCAASAAPLNPAYRAAELEFYLSDLSPKAVVVQSGCGSPARDVARSLGITVLELNGIPDTAGLFTITGSAGGAPNSSGICHSDDVALLLHTSGTTSRPKLVPLTHRNLHVSAQNVRQTLGLTERDRCLNVMPLFHVHGLVASVLASLAGGASVVCTPGFYASEFCGWLAAFDPTWYTAVPTMHQSILSYARHAGDIVTRSNLRFIRSCSAPLPPQVMDDLEHTFRAPVLEAYGMTEAAHQMASNPLPPRKRKPGSVGPAAGPEIAIVPERGYTILPPCTKGEIAVRGPNVTSGYLDNPGANAAAFSADWFRTGDEGFLDEEGYLFVTGRLKELINRGGEKIAPREVDEVLLTHPGVCQAVTFALPDALLGEDVAAAVVLRDSAVDEKELRHFAAKRLAPFKVPRVIVALDEIPKGPTGKPQRIGLAAKLGLTGVTRPASNHSAPFVTARTEVEELLCSLWCEVLKLPSVSVEERFVDAGGDSILGARLVERIGQVFEVEMQLIDFFEAGTVEKQAVLLQDLIRKDLQRGEDRQQ